MTGPSGPLSERLRLLSQELRSVELELKSATLPEMLLLQDFRHVIDNTRITAWTVIELLNARERQQDPEMVLSFVAAERLRRSNQMLKELCADINGEDVTWRTNGITSLFETVRLLEVQLIKLIHDDRKKLVRAENAAVDFEEQRNRVPISEAAGANLSD
jgi:hypothetical protein